MALQLTKDLMKLQQLKTPITLNSLLSSWLLQERKPSIKMSTLLERSTMVYEYLK